jgi:hypothetical protein
LGKLVQINKIAGKYIKKTGNAGKINENEGELLDNTWKQWKAVGAHKVKQGWAKQSNAMRDQATQSRAKQCKALHCKAM